MLRSTSMEDWSEWDTAEVLTSLLGMLTKEWEKSILDLMTLMQMPELVAESNCYLENSQKELLLLWLVRMNAQENSPVNSKAWWDKVVPSKSVDWSTEKHSLSLVSKDELMVLKEKVIRNTLFKSLNGLLLELESPERSTEELLEWEEHEEVAGTQSELNQLASGLVIMLDSVLVVEELTSGLQEVWTSLLGIHWHLRDSLLEAMTHLLTEVLLIESVETLEDFQEVQSLLLLAKTPVLNILTKDLRTLWPGMVLNISRCPSTENHLLSLDAKDSENL